MSAFIVSAPTIDAAVAAIMLQEAPMTLDAATTLGRALWGMNVEAVSGRYGCNTGTREELEAHAAALTAALAYDWTPRDLPLPALVKALHCLHYQCDEEAVEAWPLFVWLDRIARRYEATGITETSAYEAAPWGLDKDDLAPEPEAEAAPEAPAFRSELTPEGEQFVMPGCERNRSPRLRQFDLFG